MTLIWFHKSDLPVTCDHCSQVEGMVHHKQTLQIKYLFPDIATDMTNRVVLAFVPKYP